MTGIRVASSLKSLKKAFENTLNTLFTERLDYHLVQLIVRLLFTALDSAILFPLQIFVLLVFKTFF